MRRLRSSDSIDCWFFIRYQDPDHHIRLRMHVNWPNADQTFLLNTLNQTLAPLLYAGSIDRIVADTYKRELERYEGLPYQAVEDIFCLDSVCMLDLITRASTFSKMQIGLISANQILDDFKMDLTEKLRFCQHAAARMQQEQKAELHLLNKTFRDDRHWIEKFFIQQCEKEQMHIAKSFFQERSTAIQAALYRMKMPTKNNNLAACFIHLSINRLFESDQRHHELSIYHYLSKIYRSYSGRKDQPQKF